MNHAAFLIAGALLFQGVSLPPESAGWDRVMSRLQQIIPGRVFVAEVLASFDSDKTGPPFTELDEALRSLERILTSAEHPVLLSLKSTAGARHIAHPFYLGQAVLSPDTTLGDLDDAVVVFRASASSGSSTASARAIDGSLAARPLMFVEYETSRLRFPTSRDASTGTTFTSRSIDPSTD